MIREIDDVTGFSTFSHIWTVSKDHMKQVEGPVKTGGRSAISHVQTKEEGLI